MAVPVGFTLKTTNTFQGTSYSAMPTFDFENRVYYVVKSPSTQNTTLFVNYLTEKEVDYNLAINDEGYLPHGAYQGKSGGLPGTFDFYESPVMTGEIRSLFPGAFVKVGGDKWTVIDPVKGFLRKNTPVTKKAFDTTANSKFSRSRPGNIGNYLNTTFHDLMLPGPFKRLLQEVMWSIGAIENAIDGGADGAAPRLTLEQMKTKEDADKMTAKVGLLTLSEWRRYSAYLGVHGFLERPVDFSAFNWLITPLTTNGAWSIQSSGRAGTDGVSNVLGSVYPCVYVNPESRVTNGEFQYNTNPSLLLNTTDNMTLYENDTITIEGTATDTDNNDIVNVRYQINSGTVVNIATGISDGVTPIPFNRQLTFKAGKLQNNGVDVTGELAEGVAQTLKVWSEDDKGGKSTIAERTFYVVPNRAPKLTINPFSATSDLINADKVTISGTTSDPDGNDVVVSYKLNGGLSTEVYRGKDGDWTFNLLLSALKDGENTIVVETVDSYKFKSSLTRKINKTANLTPLAKSVQRYTIVPPAGTAQGVFLWIERDATQSITADISMTNGTEQEQFVAMTLDSLGPENVGTVEDFFKFRAVAPADKIAIKLSWTGDKPIFKVSGALTQ